MQLVAKCFVIRLILKKLLIFNILSHPYTTYGVRYCSCLMVIEGITYLSVIIATVAIVTLCVVYM